MANEFLFRSGIVGSLITQLIFILAALLLYRLFEEVNKTQAALMVVLALVSVPIAMLNTLNLVAALQYVTDPDRLMFFLDLNTHGLVIASIFWGLWLFPLGLLIYQSGYFHKLIGICVIIGGFGYFLSSFTYLLLPDAKLLLSIFETMTFGEVLFLAWIVILGARLPKVEAVH